MKLFATASLVPANNVPFKLNAHIFFFSLQDSLLLMSFILAEFSHIHLRPAADYFCFFFPIPLSLRLNFLHAALSPELCAGPDGDCQTPRLFRSRITPLLHNRYRPHDGVRFLPNKKGNICPAFSQLLQNDVLPMTSWLWKVSEQGRGNS